MFANIEAERVRNRMSKEQLAAELEISLKTYYNWINGKTAIPSTALIKMSSVFGVEIGYLLKGSITERKVQKNECTGSKHTTSPAKNEHTWEEAVFR